MKKIYIGLVSLVCLAIAAVAFADIWNYVYTTPQPATVSEDGSKFYRIDIDLRSNMINVYFQRYSAADGAIKNDRVQVYNIPDDPETPGVDESTTDWDDTIAAITSGDVSKGLLTVLRNRIAPIVKTKADLPAGALQ
jgi:hypothetical protein